MDDPNLLEHLVADEMERRAGPEPIVDDAAVFAVITAAQVPKWRFGSMFNATKFVVAGAIVALFGGFLLAGMLTTQQGDKLAPAAVTASPSPEIDLLPGVGLVTEEVEPGVYRVLSDGIRDLSAIGPANGQSHAEKDGLAVAPGGAVWLHPGGDETKTLIKLGDPGLFPALSEVWPVLRFSDDGVLWGHDRLALHRLDEAGWSEVTGTYGPFDIDAGGAVWSTAPWSYRDGANVVRLDAAGWQEYPIDLESFDDELRQLMGDYGVDPDKAHTGPYFEDLRIDMNGDVWAALSVRDGGVPMVLLHYDGNTWSLVDPVGLGGYRSVGLLDVGTDGTMWVYLVTGIGSEKEPEKHHLARLADDRWTVFSEEDGVVDLWERGDANGLQRVDPEGAVWMQPQGDGVNRGVRVFDGRTWRHYLDDHAVIDIEFATDGKAWVLTSDDLYVVTPEAVTATE